MPHPKISSVSVKRRRIADGFPYDFFVCPAIMNATFGLPRVYDFMAITFDSDLSFQRMTFFPE
jgi:hypothetical protein